VAGRTGGRFGVPLATRKHKAPFDFAQGRSRHSGRDDSGLSGRFEPTAAKLSPVVF
jgi:hypothetical protein